jgi:hypothetical protein
MNPNAGTHPHRWRIAEAVASTSEGVCQICGTERIFKNWTSASEEIGRMQIGLPPSRPSAALVSAHGRPLTRAG